MVTTVNLALLTDEGKLLLIREAMTSKGNAPSKLRTSELTALAFGKVLGPKPGNFPRLGDQGLCSSLSQFS